jgi:two-component system, cell cycle sensor histidine kinase and response regulator CckA
MPPASPDPLPPELPEPATGVNEERYRLVVETSGSMIYDYDLLSGDVYRSAALRTVLRWEESEPLETWWTDRVHPDDRARLASIVDPVLRSRTGPQQWTAEYRWRRGDGVYVQVQERGTVQRDAAGTPVRCIGTVTDVSERAELASQLRQSQKMEAVGQLAGGIAHDFNNLLTAISCNVELLLDALEPDDERREDVLQIREASARAAALTRQLLAYSRRQVLQPAPLDLNATVGNMERLLRRVLSAEVHLATTLEPSLPTVYADSGQMEQVVMNLVLNARDAMPAGGPILISTQQETLHVARAHRFGILAPGEYVALAVQDAGVGIEEEVLERLFEPFFTTKGQGKGTGLGLATVHGIVSQSEGQITVESTRGQGSRFTVYLPVHRGSTVAPVAAATSRATTEPGTRTVFIVDDEAAVRDVCIRAIARQGYRVVGASGGDSALALIGDEGGQDELLLLTDVMMPGMNGFELAARVAARLPRARIAMMSGFSADELARQGLATPGYPMLAKPFSLPALAQFVAHAFEQPAGADSADT